MAKEFFANYKFDCERCENEIEQDDQFYFFDDDKICSECWEKLVAFYESNDF